MLHGDGASSSGGTVRIAAGENSPGMCRTRGILAGQERWVVGEPRCAFSPPASAVGAGFAGPVPEMHPVTDPFFGGGIICVCAAVLVLVPARTRRSGGSRRVSVCVVRPEGTPDIRRRCRICDGDEGESRSVSDFRFAPCGAEGPAPVHRTQPGR